MTRNLFSPRSRFALPRIVLSGFFALTLCGCDIVREWEEEVKLHDGKVIVAKRMAIKEFTWALGDPPYRPKEFRIALHEPVKVEWRGEIRPIAIDVYSQDT